MSYQSFDFSFPTRICFGVGESEKAAEYDAQLHPEKMMILTYADVRLPVLDKLLRDLDEKKITYVLYDRCTGNPKAEQIDAATEFCVENKCDLVLGVGGGSVIDSAKAVAMMAVNPTEGGVWTYVSGEAEPQNHALPIMMVVTIASTGLESDESFVLTDRDEKQKLIYNNPMVRPTLSICDPALSVTLPARQTALGAADVLSHVMEQYLHSDPTVNVSDNMCMGIMEAVVRWAPVAIAEPEDLDARSNLLWASILAMSRVLGVGHEENRLRHLLEHAVSARYNIAHTAGMTGIFPAYLRWLKANAPAAQKKLEGLAKLFGAEDAAEGFPAFVRSLGLPATLLEAANCQASEQILDSLAENAMPWGDMPVGGFGMLTVADARNVLADSFSSEL